jgi:8-oxo-dGTP diphosphatase
MTTKQPVIGIGAVVIHDNQILLVKRANPPKQGLWCIPGGKVEFGETLQQAAEREIKEETGVVIKATTPVYVFDLIEDEKRHYVIIDLLADYVSGAPKAGDDADDAKWFSLQDIDLPDIDSETKRLLRKLIEQRTDLLK